jgi:hypothetical protein
MSDCPPEPLRLPCWIPCAWGCGDFWCLAHGMHAHDCPCPSIEEWEVDPYSEGGPRTPPRTQEDAP